MEMCGKLRNEDIKAMMHDINVVKGILRAVGGKEECIEGVAIIAVEFFRKRRDDSSK